MRWGVLAVVLAGCGGSSASTGDDVAPAADTATVSTPVPGATAPSEPTSQGTTPLPPTPGRSFDYTVDGVSETLQSAELEVIRATGADCTTSDTVLAYGIASIPGRPVYMRLEVEAPLAVGATGPVGKDAGELEGQNFFALGSSNSAFDSYHSEAWHLEALGPDMLELSLDPGQVCFDGVHPFYDAAATCGTFTEARLSLALKPDDLPFAPTPVLCAEDDKTTDGALCQAAGPREPCP